MRRVGEGALGVDTKGTLDSVANVEAFACGGEDTTTLPVDVGLQLVLFVEPTRYWNYALVSRSRGVCGK